MNFETTHKNTLVLGASTNTDRYSNRAIISLTNNSIPTFAIGLREGNIGDVKIEIGLPNYSYIHTITLYLNPQRQTAYYNYILSSKPTRVIFNPGTENPELMSLLEDNEIGFEVACTLVLLATDQY